MSRQKLRKQTEAITSEHALQVEAIANDHLRDQRVKDAVNRMACFLVYAAPAGLILMGMVYMGHLILTQRWDQFYAILVAAGSLVGGYAMRYLQERGINKE